MTQRRSKPQATLVVAPQVAPDQAVRIASVQAALALPSVGSTADAVIRSAEAFEAYIRRN